MDYAICVALKPPPSNAGNHSALRLAVRLIVKMKTQFYLSPTEYFQRNLAQDRYLLGSPRWWTDSFEACTSFTSLRIWRSIILRLVPHLPPKSSETFKPLWAQFSKITMI